VGKNFSSLGGLSGGGLHNVVEVQEFADVVLTLLFP
jgi:hypothetical protein